MALDSTQTMAWTCREVEQFIEKEPLLGVALIEELVAGTLELQDRIHIIARCPIRERVMFALITLARSLGQPMPDGASACCR